MFTKEETAMKTVPSPKVAEVINVFVNVLKVSHV